MNSPSEIQTHVDDINRKRHNSLSNVPYHHNFDLQQLFDTCRVYIIDLEQRFWSNVYSPALSQRLKVPKEVLKTVSAHFCCSDDISDESSYILVLMLQKMYELLRHAVDFNSSQTGIIDISPPDPPEFLTVIPHGQVHISLEKLAENHMSPKTSQNVLRSFSFIFNDRLSDWQRNSARKKNW